VITLRQKKILPKLLFAVFAVGIFVASYYLGNQYARPLTHDLGATVLPQPEKIREFHLVDKNGDPFTSQSLKNFWNFVIVGSLQDTGCDSLLRLYVQAWNNLAHKPALQRQTRVVFIDPGLSAQQPEQWKQAIEFYNPAFTAVSGEQEEIRKLGRQIGLFTETTACSTSGSVVALINPEGYLLALFTGETDPRRIAADLEFFN